MVGGEIEGEARGGERGGEAEGSWKEEREERRSEWREEGKEGKRSEVKGIEWIRVLREERGREVAAERSSSVVAKVVAEGVEVVPEVEEVVPDRRLEDFFFIFFRFLVLLFFFLRVCESVTVSGRKFGFPFQKRMTSFGAVGNN